jgi:hypothetical protein
MLSRSAVFMIALGAVVASAQTADDVARETQRLKSQIEQERRLAASDSVRFAEWRRQSRERLATMRAEAARLARERDSLRGFVARKLQAPPPPPPRSVAAVRRKAFAAAVAARIDASLPLLAKAGGEASSSRSDLEALSRSLKAGTGEASEGLSRLFDAWAEAIDGAGQLSARSGTLTAKSGRAVRGTYVSLGGILEAFVDRTGEFAALRNQGAADWSESVEPSTALALREAAMRVQGEGDPGWAWLPAAPAGGAK